MEQQEKREFFAGSNSYYGFWSYFESIALSDSMTRLLIKGGPGFGKSTMMKKIGAYFSQEGFVTEWFRCPSDPDSMDAIVVPQAGFCVIDATAPHALVPIRPQDEILNLWKYWEPSRHGIEEKTVPGLEIEIEKEEGKYEQWLHKTRQEWEEQEKDWRKILEQEVFYPHMQREVEQQTQAIEEQFFQEAQPSREAGVRHLFAAGFTPDGIVNLAPKLFDETWKFVGIHCCMQPVAEKWMKTLAEKCQAKGLYTEVYHSPADPRKIDIVALPQTRKAVVRMESFGVSYQDVLPEQQFQGKIELCESAQCQKQLYFTKQVDVHKITDCLQRRRHRHQKVEERYKSAMDYAGIDAEVQSIIERFSGKEK